MRKKIRRICFLLVGMALGLMIAAGQAEAAKKLMVVGTAPSGSAVFPYMVGVATIVNKAVPELALSPQETGGSVANIRLLDEGEIQVSGFSAMVAVSAVAGKKPFKKKRNVQVLFTMYQQRFVWFGRKGSGVSSWNDLVGKKMVVGSAGGSTRVIGTLVAKAKGIEGKTKLVFLRPPAMINALRDGTVDGGYGLITGTAMAPFVKEIVSTLDVNIFGADEATIRKASRMKEGVFKVDVPAGMIKGKSGFSTLGESLVMGVSSRMDNGTTYKITKAVFDNFKRLPRFTPTVKGLKTDNLVKGIPSGVLFHPGAARLLKEKGLLK